ncbi:MAG: winged helix-turn-helix domain-containing protein [Bryobacteraceae bacterium]
MYATINAALNRDEMERRRLEAAQDLLRGVTQARVARKFGVSRTTASRWSRTLEGQGVDRLRKRKAPGRPSRLSTSQMDQVREIFTSGPRAFGFETDRWTTARLARAIEMRFGVRYDPDHVGRLMHRLGLRSKPPAVILEQAPEPVYAVPVAYEMQL